ncbi:ArnT family glycosyltransferase [Ekhidna sp. To15]|uniref:ArnT family glycosyltransferase n=1 Tax=Ekhidna sp. To15 TaxID=3395267 RepID=UPI003F5213CC
MKTGYLPYLYVFVAFLVVRFLIGFDGLYGQDSYEYLRYSAAMHQYFTEGSHPGDYFWSVGFPILVAIFSLIGIPVLTVIQGVNFLSLLGIIYFSNGIIKELNKDAEYTSIYLIIVLASSPFLVQSSLVIMTDIFTTFGITGAFLFGLKYKKNLKWKWLFLFTILSCCAVFTRYVAILPLSILGIMVIVTWLKNIKWLHISVLIIPAIFIILHFHFKQNETGSFLSHQWLLNWSPLNMLKRSFETVDGFHLYTIPNLFYAFSSFVHAGFLVAGSFLLLVYLKHSSKNKTQNHSLLIVASIAIYALFLAGIPFQNKRFLLITFPLIVVWLYPAFHTIVSSLKRKPIFKSHFFVIVTVSLIAVNSLLAVYVMDGSVKRSLLEKNIARQMAPYEGRTLYGFDIDIALQGRGCDFNYKNLWKEEYHNFDGGSLVIFNPDKLAIQWSGKNPMINWQKLNENHELTLLKSFDEGWNLYEIK